MAKLERTINGNFEQVKEKIKNGILQGSMSASLEDMSYLSSGDLRSI